jgi:CheY-like chemotaxis protein
MIRQQEQDRHIPIIALTANAMPRDHQLCYEAGMDDLVVKPFTKTDLANSLKRWLEFSAATPHQPPQGVRSAEAPDRLTTLDFPVLERLEREMGEDFHEVMGAIRQSIDEILIKLEQEASSLPAAEVTRLAHSLKSPSATIGARYLYEMARDFEHAADQGPVIDIPARLMGLKQEYQRVLNLMRERGF